MDGMLIKNWEEQAVEAESEPEHEEATLKHRQPKEPINGHASILLVTDGEEDFSILKAISGDGDEILDFKPLIVNKMTNYEQIIDYKKNDNTRMREIQPLPVYTDHQANGSSSNGNTEVEETSKYKRKDTKMREILPLALSTQPENSSSSNVNTEHGRIEYVLEEAFQKPETHGFYCPNCRACIDKVIVQKRGRESKGRIRCTSCFSFLIPAANWVFPNWVANEEDGGSDEEGISNPANPTQDTAPVPKKPSEVPPPRHSVGNAITEVTGIPAVPVFKPTIGTNDPPPHHSLGNPAPEIPEIPAAKPPPKANDGSPCLSTVHTQLGFLKNPATKPHSAVPASKPRTDTNDPVPHHNVSDVPIIPSPKPTTDTNDPVPPHHTVEIPEEQGQASVQGSRTDDHTSQTSPTEDSGDDRKLEIMKSIVYGGLVESIASLGIVTSAASSNAKTLNIIALAVANLISGLFVLVNNLWELKPNQSERGSNNTDAKARRYQELLGHRDHFLLHTSLAILSFLIFGLVPPVVYGFSFQKSDDKDLKLAAVAGASFLCIVLLAIAKAYTNQSKKFVEYFKTVVYYVSTSAVASVAAYLAGKLINQVLERLGWFESGQPITDFSLGFPQMSTQSHAWESY